MRRIFAFIVALLVAAVSAVTAFAAGINENERKVLDELRTSVNMQGAEMYWSEAYVNQAENYFNTIDMTADQAEQIIAIIRNGKTRLEATGARNIAECTPEQKKELMTFLTEVMEPVNGTAYFDSVTGEVALKSEKGEVIFKAVPTLISKDGAKSVDINGKTTDGGVIKITGAANDVFSCILIFAAAASVMAFGIFVAVRKLR